MFRSRRWQQRWSAVGSRLTPYPTTAALASTVDTFRAWIRLAFLRRPWPLRINWWRKCSESIHTETLTY